MIPANVIRVKTSPAEMVFAVQELQLDSRTAALVARNQVAELAENVTTNLVSICLNAATYIFMEILTFTMFS